MFQSRNDIRQALHRSSKLLSGCHGSFAACAEAAVACQSENISGSVFGPEGSFLSRVKDAQIRLMRWRLLSALLATLPAVGQPVPPTEELAAGGRSYSLLCVQCHGEDGDATSYPGVLPLAGIARRYPAEVIGQLSGTFSGRFLFGQDRQRLVAYLSTLRGSKGFADPGWLVSPYLLEKRLPQIRQVRVIDTRGAHQYASAHIPNAVAAQSSFCAAESIDDSGWLADLGVTPSTLVVVYDDQGGPSAACTWLRIRQAGHRWVAVLDGGWIRWAAEKRATTTVVPRIERTDYAVAVSRDAVRTSPSEIMSLTRNDWNWKATLAKDGFRSQEELSGLFARAGLVPGSSVRMIAPAEEIAHLILVLHLLGFGADYDSDSETITISAGFIPHGASPADR